MRHHDGGHGTLAGMPYFSLARSGLPLAGAALLALLAVMVPDTARAAPKTVCTITINSSDERESFQRHLPPGDYRFVELVQRSQPDWFANACHSGVQCDALVISGHFDDGTEFYTDRLGDRDNLPVSELESASCSQSCDGVLAHVKEVYLFGCNTLKDAPRHVAEGEVLRSLTRAGLNAADAQRAATALNERYGQSNRDRLRTIFKGVPLLYGFSSKAPLGRYAGPLMDRYFQSAPVGEVGSGRPSSTLLQLFSPSSMIVTSGIGEAEARSGHREDMCRFADSRRPAAAKVTALHEMLLRSEAESRMFLDHLERFAASIDPQNRHQPEVAAALDRIRADEATRGRFLALARDADQASAQTRMFALAGQMGWLSREDEQAEFVNMVSTRMAKGTLGLHEVDHICTTAQAQQAPLAPRVRAAGSARSENAAHAAALACLGDREGHDRTLRALTSSRDDDVAIAQVYLRHRPLADLTEVRAVAAGIGRMTSPQAQVRALEALAKQRLADAQSLQAIAKLFPAARSLDMQRAIAGILIRSDYRQLEAGELARTLKQHRRHSPGGKDVIDMLIQLLQAA
jgi:hypothetical protein